MKKHQKISSPIVRNFAIIRVKNPSKKFRSGLEKKINRILQNAVRVTPNLSVEYETEKIEYVVKRTYLIDFKIINDKKRGRKYAFYIEAKGWFKSEDRTKLKLVRDQNPTLDIRLVFQKPFNKLNKNSKTTYADWADKNGFQWCSADGIPKRWIDELLER